LSAIKTPCTENSSQFEDFLLVFSIRLLMRQ
jgi:hypothetical protein